MEITILQQNIVWSNPEANRKKADEAINRNPGADLYVYPKCFRQVFAHNPKELQKVPIAKHWLG